MGDAMGDQLVDTMKELPWHNKERGYHNRATCLLHMAIYFALSFIVIFVSSTEESILLHKL